MEVDKDAVYVMVHIMRMGCVIDVCYDKNPTSENYVTVELPKVPHLSELKQLYPNAEIEVRDRR